MDSQRCWRALACETRQDICRAQADQGDPIPKHAGQTNHAKGTNQLITNHSPPIRCLWCGHPFTPRCSGGKAQRFCLPQHRRAFETAARCYVSRLIAAGELSIGAIHSAPETRALLPGDISGMAATTLAGAAQPRSPTPIQILWAGAVDLANDSP